MRFTRVSIAAACALGLLTIWTSSLRGQQQQPRPATRQQQPANSNPPAGKAQVGNGPVTQTGGQAPVKPQRPAANEMVVEQISPELEGILKQWEAKSSKIKTLHGEHRRTVYNPVFEVEKISKGDFALETPDKGKIKLIGESSKATSSRIGKSGRPFRIESDRAETWICNGDFVFMLNDEEKTYEQIEIPPEQRGNNIVNSPLPFLFGMKADEMKRRYSLKLERNTATSAVLIATPRLAKDLQNYNEAWIILEKTNYLPTAVKLFDSNGNTETVYKFENVKVNDDGMFNPLGIFKKSNPYDPNFKRMGYSRVLPQVAEKDEFLLNPKKPTGQSPNVQKGATTIPASGTKSGLPQK